MYYLMLPSHQLRENNSQDESFANAPYCNEWLGFWQWPPFIHMIRLPSHTPNKRVFMKIILQSSSTLCILYWLSGITEKGKNLAPRGWLQQHARWHQADILNQREFCLPPHSARGEMEATLPFWWKLPSPSWVIVLSKRFHNTLLWKFCKSGWQISFPVGYKVFPAPLTLDRADTHSTKNTALRCQSQQTWARWLRAAAEHHVAEGEDWADHATRVVFTGI